MRVLVPATALVALAAIALAVLIFRDPKGPRLVSDTVSARGGVLKVHYRYDEPVRAVLLVDGKPAEETKLETSGSLDWHERSGHHRFAIEGIDRAGRHSSLTTV